MKCITFLTLVVLIFLSSCKGSSFLTQRYTNYGHSKSKTISGVAAKKTYRPEPKVEMKKTEAVVQESSIVLVCDNGPDRAVKNPAKQKQTIRLTVKHPIIFASKQFKAIADKHFVSQKEKKSEKKNALRGAVNKLLKIVLLILILAIIAGIIIILLLVGV